MAPSYWKIDEEAEENQVMVGQQGGEVDAGTIEDRDQREVPGEPGQGPRPGRVPSPQGGTNSPERHSQRVSSSGTRHRHQGFAAH